MDRQTDTAIHKLTVNGFRAGCGAAPLTPAPTKLRMNRLRLQVSVRSTVRILKTNRQKQN